MHTLATVQSEWIHLLRYYRALNGDSQVQEAHEKEDEQDNDSDSDIENKDTDETEDEEEAESEEWSNTALQSFVIYLY